MTAWVWWLWFLAVTGLFGADFWLFLAWVRCFRLWLWFLVGSGVGSVFLVVVVVVVFVLKGVVGRGWVRGLGLGWVVGGLWVRCLGRG